MTEIVTQSQDAVGVIPSPTVSLDIATPEPASIADVIPTVESSPPVEAVKTDEITSEVKTDEVKKESTLLGDQPEAKTESKEETKEPAQADEKEQEGSKSDEPATLPTYDEFQAPEGFTLDEALIGDFSKTLGEFERTTNADHAEVQKFGQSLIDRHVAEVKTSIDRYTTSLMDAFEQQKSDWRQSFENDPEIGGNRKDTTVNAALEFIRTHGGNEEQRKEIHQIMDQTGIGNHPAMIRLLAQAARSSSFMEGKPLPATMPVPTVKNKIEKRYGVS